MPNNYGMSRSRFGCVFLPKVLALGCILFPASVPASSLAAQEQAGNASQNVKGAATGMALYRDLLNPVLGPVDVHRIRQVAVDREDLHFTLNDGMIGLIRAQDGHVTGAVFEGEGEILMFPPNRAERTSLVLFTGSGVLEQTFNSAYLRFFDDKLVEELQAGFRPAEDAQEFIDRWTEISKGLARIDALPILRAMTNAQDPGSRFLHLRLGGTRLGVFDVMFDANAREQFSLGQARTNNEVVYFDVWSSFPMRSTRGERDGSQPPRFTLDNYRMRLTAQPPTDLSAETEFVLTPLRAGQRTVILELSRYLRVSGARAGGQPLELIQNEAVSGSDLARRGNDLVALVFPTVLEKDHPVKVTMSYSGPVMFSAGDELLYVGFRGTWYPNAGPTYSSYDLTFDFPEDWLLVATGKLVSSTVEKGRRTSRFTSEKPIARAGFNLGKFETATATAGNVSIHVYAAKNVEKGLAVQEARAGKRPQPAREARQIADQAAASVKFLSSQLDPFPYSNLEISQIPGVVSQAWPGLIYLSSLAYLDADERRGLNMHDPYTELLLGRLMLSHETAHQWWGDTVDPVSYRDEWMTEALANYCALLMLEKDDPQSMRMALDFYKGLLLKDTSNGIVGNAGPVTLGVRLSSSKFPEGYERVVYGRGTWLIHMLRTMLQKAGSGDDALFFSALKSLLAKAPDHKISTRDLQLAFEQVLPASLYYENNKSLDWFFDSWINGADVPDFGLDQVNLAPSGGKVKVTAVIKESHADKDLVTAVPIYGVDEKGNSRFLSFVFADEAETAFTLTAPAGTRQILLDPENTLLRR
jgi:hypothetical protein